MQAQIVQAFPHQYACRTCGFWFWQTPARWPALRTALSELYYCARRGALRVLAKFASIMQTTAWLLLITASVSNSALKKSQRLPTMRLYSSKSSAFTIDRLNDLALSHWCQFLNCFGKVTDTHRQYVLLLVCLLAAGRARSSSDALL